MQFLSLVAGIVLILLAALATVMGVDPNGGWGKGRLFLLFTGLLLVCLPVAGYAYRRWAPASVRERFSAMGQSVQKLVNRVCGITALTPVLAVVVLAVFSGYALWFTSAGKFPVFYSIDNYYIRQGSAFLRGQLNLLDQPSPQLLALQNPYDFKQRQTVPYLWDITLYQGHYYTYWGPVPALMYAALEGLTGVTPAAQPLGVVLLIGLDLIALALLYQFRRWFFPRAPALTLVLFLLAATVNLPATFLLARTLVYEISILAGQFFLFLGLLWWVLYLKNNRTVWVALAGLSWGLAVGSRTNLVVSVLVYVGFVFFHFWRTAGKPRAAHLPWRKIAALCTPLALCALALAWYNWARFGNVLETGANYQLSLDVSMQQLFSIRYVVPNLYAWLFYSPALKPSFPFVDILKVANANLPAWAAFNSPQRFERIFWGLLPMVPVLGLLVFTLPVFARRALRERSGSQVHSRPAADPSLRWELMAMIGLTGFIQLGLMLVFFYGSVRYVTNFYLSLLLLVVFTVWAVDDLLRSRPRLRAAFWGGVTLLIVWGAAAGFLGGFVVEPNYFYNNNTALYNSISATCEKPVLFISKYLKVMGVYWASILRLLHFT
jgi:hypothetical protein